MPHRTQRLGIFLVLAALVAPAPVLALHPVGARIPIAVGGLSADVGMDAMGRFVVAWQEQRGLKEGVFAQRFGADGRSLGSAFTVIDDGGFPGVGMHSSGSFDVLWTDLTTMWVRRFDAAGVGVGPFEVATGDYIAGDIASAGPNGFAVVWNSFDFDEDDHDVFVRLFDRAGVPRGSEILVNEPRDHLLDHVPGIAVDYEGNFLLLWRRYILPAAIVDRLNGEGAFVGGYYLGQETYPEDIAAEPGGGFVVVESSGYPAVSVRLRRYDAAGNVVGGEIPVTPSGADASIATNGAGRFVVTWWSEDEGVVAQRFECDKDCPPTAVTTTTSTTTTTTLPGSCLGTGQCATTANCHDAVAAALPDPAVSPDKRSRKTAKKLFKLERKARKKLARAAGQKAGAKQDRLYEKARKSRNRLLQQARRGEEKGTLGVPLEEIEVAVASLLALIPAASDVPSVEGDWVLDITLIEVEGCTNPSSGARIPLTITQSGSSLTATAGGAAQYTGMVTRCGFVLETHAEYQGGEKSCVGKGVITATGHTNPTVRAEVRTSCDDGTICNGTFTGTLSRL